jgi:hypothetical protein
VARSERDRRQGRPAPVTREGRKLEGRRRVRRKEQDAMGTCYWLLPDPIQRRRIKRKRSYDTTGQKGQDMQAKKIKFLITSLI